jgi:hypothetical protein
MMAALMAIIVMVLALNATLVSATSLAHQGMSKTVFSCLARVVGIASTDQVERTGASATGDVNCLVVPGFNMITPTVYLASIGTYAGDIAVAMTQALPAMNNVFVVNFDYRPAAGANGNRTEIQNLWLNEPVPAA